ncbi:MAG TPA: hypothetical protein DD400_00050 [Rhodospirillaceae bacterium]|nr:hypothetical protein [Rhodospirillaceae bacterium]
MTALTFVNRQTSSRAPFSFEAFQIEKRVHDLPRARITNIEEARTLLQESERLIAQQKEKIHRLEKSSLTDELTGLSNRLGFMSALRRELANTRRNEKNAGLLVLVDLDDFEQVSNAYDSIISNLYLQTTASVLINEVRSYDYVARLSNNTFAVLMPKMSSKATAKRLSKLERAVNSRVVHHRDTSVPLSASLGFTMLEEEKTPEALLIEADLSLFTSKARKK